MAYETMGVRIRGLVPTIMHNGQLADPMNQWARAIKEITSKRKKTAEDLAELMRLEWYGGLYVDDRGAPCWPGENIEAMLKTAAKTEKMGKQVDKGLRCNGNWPLIYDGPKTADELWALDPKYRFSKLVRVGQVKVMRTRPIFSEWELKCELLWNPSKFNAKDLEGWLAIAGDEVGLSDWQRKYGLFEVVDVSA